MKTLAVTNQKGGVGKSSASLAIAHSLAARGLKVLVCDLDPQGNTSATLRADGLKPSVLDVLQGDTSITEAIRAAGSVHILPADKAAITAMDSLDVTALKAALEEVAGFYDFCVIDTPPALDKMQLNALAAAQSIVIPVQADTYSLMGLEDLIGTLATVKASLNPSLKVAGIFFNVYNPRAILSRELKEDFEEIAARLDTRLFDAAIRRGQAITDASALRKPLREYAPKAGITQDYEALTSELLERL